MLKVIIVVASVSWILALSSALVYCTARWAAAQYEQAQEQPVESAAAEGESREV